MKDRNWTLCGRYVDENNTIKVAKDNFEITCKACRRQTDESSTEEEE